MLSLRKSVLLTAQKTSLRCLSTKTEPSEVLMDDEFRVLNLKQVKEQRVQRKKFKQPDPMPPRFQQMPVDQDWGAVWPGPKSFHPAAVPLPLRQGWTPKNQAPPSKYTNTELMKIPNFLHLTPPVIRKQCEALKKFCTPWPKGLETEEKIEAHFPLQYVSSDYVHGLPTIRNPMSRIVTIKIKLARLNLDQHARDKFLRLVGERYNKENDEVTIVTDRCPLKKQNYDYGVYLLTALYHESKTTEEWENTKVEADMEVYIWNNNKSKQTSSDIINWKLADNNKVQPSAEYVNSVEQLINEGENDYNLEKYKSQVVQMLGLKQQS